MSSQQTTAVTPTTTPFMTRDEVLQVVPVCHTTLYQWMADGYFPRSISLGPKRSNGYAGKAFWLRESVDAWIREQTAKAAQPA